MTQPHIPPPLPAQTTDTVRREPRFRRAAAAGAFSAALAVALGAFGAHGLRHILSPEMLAVYDTGVRYQMYHALALLAAGISGNSLPDVDRRLLAGACWAFCCGTLLFSGSKRHHEKG